MTHSCWFTSSNMFDKHVSCTERVHELLLKNLINNNSLNPSSIYRHI